MHLDYYFIMRYIAPICLVSLSGNVDKELLDTLCEVEISELRRCGGE